MDLLLIWQIVVQNFSFYHLIACVLGVTIGIIVGMIPGLGAFIAMSLLMPLAYHTDIVYSLITMAGIWYGSMYGGSVSSILLNLPGTPSTAITCIEGYAMTQKNKAFDALVFQALSSFVGGIVGLLVVIFGSVYLTTLAIQFHSVDYASLMILCLILACVTQKTNFVKNLAMVMLGASLAFIGLDLSTGNSRGTFGLIDLDGGIKIGVLLLGLFGLSEVMWQLKDNVKAKNFTLTKFNSFKNVFKQFFDHWASTLRGSTIGSIVGILPALGPAFAAVMSYSTEKSLSKTPDKFGTGVAEGILSPEAANNSAAHTSFIPTLSLGIPGDISMVFILSIMSIHGIATGPTFFQNHSDIFWMLMFSFLIGNIILLALSFVVIPYAQHITNIPPWIIYPIIILFCCIGAYSLGFNVFDVYLMAGIGILGYLLRYFEFSFVPLLFGFILSPLLEVNVRRALLISDGDFLIFLERPLSAGFLLIGSLIVVSILTKFYYRNKK